MVSQRSTLGALGLKRTDRINQDNGPRSLTETELMGVNDSISNILSSIYFLQEQGCGTVHIIIDQDNKSAILLSQTGRYQW
eukprot:CCRYP_012304-RA/>CCRYP_012304-RA protein AED:0.45 eAED:0.45 QI:0/0/0/1/0/0/2/0/80